MPNKIPAKAAVARLLAIAGLTAPRRRGRHRLSIATFHRVLPASDRAAYPYPGLVITPEELDACLSFFQEHYDCGTLAQQHERFLGNVNEDRPLLALTFDDAQYDNFRHARTILARRRLKASFFVPVVAVERREPLWHDRLGFAVLSILGRPGGENELQAILSSAGLSDRRSDNVLDRAVQDSKCLSTEGRLRLVDALTQAAGSQEIPPFARLMTFDELGELAADGHEIGSHSMTHRMMPECDDESLTYELEESRRTLRDRLGLPIESFCYPNGDSDARSAAAVARAGYRRAVTTAWGANDASADRFRLRRLDMDASRMRDARGRIDPALLALRMSGIHPRAEPLDRSP